MWMWPIAAACRCHHCMHANSCLREAMTMVSTIAYMRRWQQQVAMDHMLQMPDVTNYV